MATQCFSFFANASLICIHHCPLKRGEALEHNICCSHKHALLVKAVVEWYIAWSHLTASKLCNIHDSSSVAVLQHNKWYPGRMATILQVVLSNEFSCMTFVVFWSTFKKYLTITLFDINIERMKDQKKWCVYKNKWNKWYGWVSARKTWFQCVGNRFTSFLY